MKIENRDYKFFDFFKIPMSVSPGMYTLLIIIRVLVIAMTPVLTAMATASFIDTALLAAKGQADKGNVVLPIAFMILLYFSQHISFAVEGLAGGAAWRKLSVKFRPAVNEKRAKLEYRHVENNETWDLINRVCKDPVNRMQRGFFQLMFFANKIVQFVSVFVLLVSQVWWAALVLAVVSVPLVWVMVKGGKAKYDAFMEADKHSRRADYYKSVMTGRESVEERALFGYSDALNKHWYERFRSAFRISMKTDIRYQIFSKSISISTVATSVIIAVALLFSLNSGGITIGAFIGMMTAVFSFMTMMGDASWVGMSITHNREYMRDLGVFAKLSETPDALDAPSGRAEIPECIEFREVSFAYPGTEIMILKGLNLKLHAGRHYAFVGINGAGKTTLTKLLTGLYDNYTGDIFIDGKNLREFTQAQIKALFSVVYQDFAKYQIPMVDSIGLGNVNDMSAEDAAEAVHTLGLDEAVEKLPDGLNTPLGKIIEEGIDLSGGEWQRVAIARALVSPAPIRILDEPTAALDPVAESEVYKMFGRISKGRSTVFITHRLGAARLADEIFVIAEGRVAEHGSHAALMDENGIYAEMFESQRGWYA